MSLMGTVAASKLDSLLDALERLCGPCSEWNLLETTFAMEKTEVKVCGCFVLRFYLLFCFSSCFPKRFDGLLGRIRCK